MSTKGIIPMQFWEESSSRKNFMGVHWAASYSIALKFCTEQGSITAVLCAKFQTEWTIEMGVVDKQDFARFEFKMSFGQISYIPLTWHSCRPSHWPLISRVTTSPQRLTVHKVRLFEYLKFWIISWFWYIIMMLECSRAACHNQLDWVNSQSPHDITSWDFGDLD